MKGQTSEDWAAKKVTVAGLGTFGGQVAAAKFFVRRGAEVTVTDSKPREALGKGIHELDGLNVRLVLGGHREKDFTNADLVVASPAIPEDNRYLAAAEAAGVPITHEMDIFFSLCRAPIIGITGSNGKSTTAALLAHILTMHCRRQAGLGSGAVWLGGNIGRSLLLEVERILPQDLVVLELSSFQLENLGELGKSPYGAIVTNLSPNHLDRHGTFEAYARAKRNITLYQKPGDFLVINADDPNLAGWDETAAEVFFFGEDAAMGRKGVFISAGSLVSTVGGIREVVKVRRRRWKLKGRHNLLNLAAACAAAGKLGVPVEQAVAAAEDFQPLAHRLEEVGSVSGVRFYNDSIATTPESAVAALESFKEPIVLIAGGYDKGLDLEPFARRAARSVKALVVIGETGDKIAKAASVQNADLRIIRPATFGEAVAAAFDEAEPGDVVLLSPACASYDMFGNFQERGERFRREVERVRCKAGGKSS